MLIWFDFHAHTLETDYFGNSLCRSVHAVVSPTGLIHYMDGVKGTVKDNQKNMITGTVDVF